MRPLSAPELLRVWERGLAQRPVERAQALLAAACPGTPPDALAQLNIGQRDARLLTLREWTFGPQAVGLATCPECGERHELTFNLADLRVVPEACDEATVSRGGYELRFRMPNSMDLAATGNLKDLARARITLLERCLLSAQKSGRKVRAEELSEEVVKAAADQMAQADPQADVQLVLSCISCSRQWQEHFDIISFFWSEIHAWACRILGEVDSLASAYGWREADILSMHPWRRQFYLEMVSG
jgi:hypothetical protein